ncbi:DEAD/DEAH box helicase [Streptomyces niveus]
MPETADSDPALAGKVEESGLTVSQLVSDRWQVDVAGDLLDRFEEPGWTYEEAVVFPCPSCQRGLHTLRRPYESGGRVNRFVAVVCPACPRVYTLAELGLKTSARLRSSPPQRTVKPREPLDLRPWTTPAQNPADRTEFPSSSECGWGPALPRSLDHGDWPAELPRPAGPETRRLRWSKVTDPGWSPEPLPDDTDLRVIMPGAAEFQDLSDRLEKLSVPYRRVAHWIEPEEVATISDSGEQTELVARPRMSSVLGRDDIGCSPVGGLGAYAARDCMELAWEALTPDPQEPPPPLPVTDLVPETWAPLLPYPTFNPAQAAAVPAVLEHDEHIVVVAPTGAGKTPIGMIGALKAHFDGRKAVWLVPQRSLTDELDRDLALWRRHGLRVVRLSGEQATDQELIKEADIWISTTEKFEALCRAASMRQALADVGCLVVDEIHLLGDPVRGPVLEALLARVRESAAEVRIVGLSATVSNAEDIAEWLNAELVRVTWRPTRLIWQLPLLPATSDRSAQRLGRMRAAVRIADTFTAEQGSVLVFCGSKRNVRSTALALAAHRGAETTAVDPDDAEQVNRACRAAKVGLHYSDWPFKKESVAGFDRRELDVMVATSTLAAGVNLPARAVIVRDTHVGLDTIEVSMVQQMFGRAGRVGAGESEGWAFLLTDEAERPLWQARLAAGYTVSSQIRNSLPDHVLAEVVQQRITTVAQARAWWKQTLAYHQGDHDMGPLNEAVHFLGQAGYIDDQRVVDESDGELAATELGCLTTRLMVSAVLANEVRVAVSLLELPQDPVLAEGMLIETVSATLPDLAMAPVGEKMRDSVQRLLKKNGYLYGGEPPEEFRGGLAASRGLAAGDFARACLLTVARSPRAFRGTPRFIAGIPGEAMYPIFAEAERYLYWLGVQGPLNSSHPWTAIVAADLSRRIRWRRIAPPRGSGRLLWILENMATSPKAHTLVPQIWEKARKMNISSPDWSSGGRPEECQLSDERYQALLRERTTGSRVTRRGDEATWWAPMGHTVTMWSGAYFEGMVSDGEEHTTAFISEDTTMPDSNEQGLAVFSRRGDGMATGWLSAYSGIGTD